MKKFLKYFLISFASLLAAVVIIVAVALWFVFTPEKLTPVVRAQASKYLNCRSETGTVELTFFSTFPKFGLKVGGLTLVNPVEGAQSDTLMMADEIIGIINISSLIRDNELIVNDFRLANGQINAFIDSAGNTNFDIFAAKTDADTAKTGMNFRVIDVNNIDLKNIDVSFYDLSNSMKADVRHLTASIGGSVESGDITGSLDAKPFDILLEYRPSDSLDLKTEIRKLSAKIEGSMKAGVIDGKLDVKPFDIKLHYNTINTEIENLSATISCATDFDDFSGNISIKPFRVTFENGNEKYLQNADIQLNAVADANFSRQAVNIKEAFVSLNDLRLDVSGTVENDTLNKALATNLSYIFSSWSVKTLVALVPPSFAGYLEGIDIGGQISSEGVIDGIYSAFSRPMANIKLKLEKGTLKYGDFPVPLREINADATVSSDLKSPQSYIRIDRFDAKTPQSSIKITGMLNNLFTDIRAGLTAEMSLSLPEFAPLIPDSMNIAASGTVSGKIKSDFTMSQITNMQAEKVKLSGSLTLSDFAATYDSLSIETNRSVIDFALPNPNPATAKNGFALAVITAKTLQASKINSFDVSLVNAEIGMEAGSLNIKDGIACVFKMDDLKASTETFKIAVTAPSGNISLAMPEHPVIGLQYHSGRIHADFDENSVTIEKLGLDVNLKKDPSKKDIVLQWTPRGFFDMEQGSIALSPVSYPVKMPALKMNFDTETFAIEKGSLILDKTDFNLSGRLSNIASWFGGDSLLRGNFDFTSGMTDIVQIMNLTNGIGYSDEEKEMLADNSTTTYLVPKTIDLTLKTNIKRATYGNDITAENIRGKIQVHNGALILDELKLSTPATDMEMTVMYRVPRRKNHLFVGISLNMLNIEIAELLQMIPAVDSIMPMLRSFRGKGEFRFAGETYVDSMYNVKMSTVRAASSIRGSDLVLMDGETFSEIAKTLKFSKKTENKVDSLSAEFTVFRDEVDVYPFLVVMDKYKAVVGGRHNLDLSFDYNISLVESPLPVRLAVDVKGTPDKMKYSPAKSKYPDFYRPATRKAVESHDLELRKVIRNALLGNE